MDRAEFLEMFVNKFDPYGIRIDRVEFARVGEAIRLSLEVARPPFEMETTISFQYDEPLTKMTASIVVNRTFNHLRDIYNIA